MYTNSFEDNLNDFIVTTEHTELKYFEYFKTD